MSVIQIGMRRYHAGVSAFFTWSFGFSLLFLATQVLLSARVLLKRAPLSNAHAWLLVIWLIPVIGMGLYLLIGENRLGSRRVRAFQENEEALRAHHQELWTAREPTWDGPYERFRPLEKLGAGLCDAPAVEGNELHLLADAAETLDAMIADIDGAQSHCHLLTYIFQPSGKPVELAEALMRAARRGVECRVALDAAGSRPFFRSKLPRLLRASGVEVVELLGVSPVRLLFRRLDLRNHRKVCVVDGRVAYSGSQNITDDSFRPKGLRGPGPWHDATARIKGHAVLALALVFIADWNSESKAPISEFDQYLPQLETGRTDGVTSAVQVLPSGPDRRPGAIQSAMIAAMYAATRELVLTTPYFVPDETINTALRTAAARGVEVTLIVPKNNDAVIVDHAGRASYEQLLASGVRIMRYTPGLLHAKTMTIDGMVSHIGSANLDQRSFRINFEITLAMYDHEFTTELREQQAKYIEQSEPVELDRWRARSTMSRVIDGAASLFSPIL